MDRDTQIIEWIETYQFETVQEHLSAWREADPKNSAVYCWQAVLAYVQDDYEAALEAADQALKIAPENEWALRCRIGALLNLRRFSEALKVSEEAIALNNSDAANRYYLAVSHFNLGNREEAIRHLEQIPPDDKQNWLVHNLQALIASKQEDYKAAEEWALHSLSGNPLQSHLHYLIGWVQNHEKRYPEAIQSCVIASLLAPEDETYKRAVANYVGAWLTPRLWWRTWIVITAIPYLTVLFQPGLALPAEMGWVKWILLVLGAGVSAYIAGCFVLFLQMVVTSSDFLPFDKRRHVQDLPMWTQAYLWREDSWDCDRGTGLMTIGALGLVGLLTFLRIVQIIPMIPPPGTTHPSSSLSTSIWYFAGIGITLWFVGVVAYGIVRLFLAAAYKKRRMAELRTAEEYPEAIAAALKASEERWPISWLILPAVSDFEPTTAR